MQKTATPPLVYIMKPKRQEANNMAHINSIMEQALELQPDISRLLRNATYHQV